MENQAAIADPSEDELGIYSQDGSLRASFLYSIEEAIDARDGEFLSTTARQLHESEMADVLDALDKEQRNTLVELAGDDFDFTVLTEVDEAIRLDIVEALPNQQIAEAFRELDSDDAVFILEDMEEGEREDVLAKIPFQDQVRLRRSLEYPEETAGRRMQTEFVAVPPFWSVGQTIDYLREDNDLPTQFAEIFLIQPTFKLAGSVALDRLLRTSRGTPIESIKQENLYPIAATEDQEEAAMVFENYNLLSAPVVDENDRLVGVLTIDDVVDVIHMEAEEDIKRLAGVGDEELSDNILDTLRSRFTWLFINLVTAIAASSIIGLFDASLEQMVALAVLMPIVASMGGNAGTQTMTVAVRALATHDLDINNARRIILRELFVGVFNGIGFALLMGFVATWWFASTQLGLVIGIAMIINMIAAALAGILMPIALDRLNIDPAIASTVFVTTVTDVIGFVAFLGLAAWWFGLG